MKVVIVICAILLIIGIMGVVAFIGAALGIVSGVGFETLEDEDEGDVDGDNPV